MTMRFPEHFQWGTATASIQIEGAAREGGRGESIWDRFASIPGNVANGDHADVACDHYHRFREDVAIMKQLHMTAYRFSIAWPRIFPRGDGEINEEGMAFYSELIDCLLENGIEPWITLYHWDLPQALQDRGGWLNAETPKIFLQYCEAVVSRFSDRVKHWMTFNEPYCATLLGYYEGRKAPGHHDFSEAILAAYNMYVAHGLAVKYFRENAKDCEVGIALNLMARLPLTDDPQDIEAARRADGYLNRWFADPILKGSYPSDMIEWYRSQGVVLPEMKSEDLVLMSQPLDFIGLNYYNDFWVKHEPKSWPVQFAIVNPPNVSVTERKWPLTEEGFKAMLLRLTNEYGVKRIVVTENGASYHDQIALDGTVPDGMRTDYLRRHIRKMYEAIQEGANVEGYFLWSLLDNYEWESGYNARFGIVYVDYETQKRTVKDSGLWYAKVAQNNAVD